MKALRNYLDKIKPNFEEGGKLAMFRSVFEGFESFLFVPNATSKTGVHIHDSIDSKRTMTVVIIALLPALLFGMYNVGYQHNLAVGANPGFWMTFIFGFLAVLPKIIVSYVVGLGIEFTVAQWKKEEIQEGFLVSGILIPMIVPVDTPLWMIAVATAFAVIFAKEVFGGTGYNIFNVALVTRAFLFFAYPTAMSGDQVWVRTADTFGIGAGQVVDGFSAATPLGIAKVINFRPGTEIMDLGTGGGFPGIPLAIMFPDTHFHLVDSIGKKVKVATEIASAIGLKNVTTRHCRAEEEKQLFDFVVSRAVMPLTDLLKIIRKNIRKEQNNALPNGLICLKGGELQNEVLPVKHQTVMYDLKDYFEEEFFETKKVVYVTINK